MLVDDDQVVAVAAENVEIMETADYYQVLNLDRRRVWIFRGRERTIEVPVCSKILRFFGHAMGERRGRRCIINRLLGERVRRRGRGGGPEIVRWRLYVMAMFGCGLG